MKKLILFATIMSFLPHDKDNWIVYASDISLPENKVKPKPDKPETVLSQDK